MFDVGYEDYEKLPINLYWSFSKEDWIKAVNSGRKILFIASKNEGYVLNEYGNLELQ